MNQRPGNQRAANQRAENQRAENPDSNRVADEIRRRFFEESRSGGSLGRQPSRDLGSRLRDEPGRETPGDGAATPRGELPDVRGDRRESGRPSLREQLLERGVLDPNRFDRSPPQERDSRGADPRRGGDQTPGGQDPIDRVPGEPGRGPDRDRAGDADGDRSPGRPGERGGDRGREGGIGRDGRPDFEGFPNTGGRPNLDGRGPRGADFDRSGRGRVPKAVGRPDAELRERLRHATGGRGLELDHRLHWDRVSATRQGQRFRLDHQYRLYRNGGDLARRLGLVTHFRHSNWRNSRHYGYVSRTYLDLHFGSFYCGPSYFPRFCWTPRWRPWVDWCWWDYCYPIYDPRPIFCRPVYYDPCPTWTYYTLPVWQPLPVVVSGTWIDVPPPPVAAAVRTDLQLLAVRFVDAGHPEQRLGPRYRVWLRNTSDTDLAVPFSVMLLATNGPEVVEGSYVESGVRVTDIRAGETQSVDIRLPFEASVMAMNDQGQREPFTHLHVLVDGAREVDEEFRDNNGASLSRGDILPVDPALFSTDLQQLSAGSITAIAGEGLGPEPGQVLLFVGGLELQAEIQGWFDLGVQVRIPAIPVAQATEMEIVVVRGDGAASNPLTVTLVPPEANAPLPAPRE